MKKHWIKIFVFLVAVAGLAAGSYLVRRVQETRKGATGGETADLSISPGQGEFAKGEKFTATVVAPASPEGKRLSNFVLHFSLDNLEVGSFVKNEGTDKEKVRLEVEGATDAVQIMEASVGKAGGNVLLVVGFINSSENYPKEGEGVVKIKLKALEAGQASIGLMSESAVTFCSVVDCLASSNSKPAGEFMASYNITEGGAPAGERVSEVSLDPDQDSFNSGDEFTVSLKADVGVNKVSMVSFDFNVSGGVELQGVEEGDDFVQIIAPGNRDSRVVLIEINMADSNASPPSPEDFASGKIDVAKFKLKKMGSESGQLLVNNIIVLGNDFTGAEKVGWEETVNRELTGQYALLSATDVQVNFKIKFGGVNKKIGDQVVKVKAVGQGVNEAFDEVGVSSDDNGVLSGRFVLSNALPGPGYALVIKGPKHLGTKFCQDGQNKRCQPGQSLTLTAGENNLDFSAYPLPPGDVSGENGEQDGVVDVEDFDVIQAGLDVSSDAAVKAKGDLNFDNANNGSDPMLFLKTMAEKYDDDI